MNRSARYALVAAIAVSGCAAKSTDIAASYVSPMQYQSYSCSQIAAEGQRVSARAAQVSGQQDRKASGDAAAMAIGMVLFWPALFFVKGDAETAGEVARLKGEMEALEQQSIQKKCGIEFRPAEPQPATP